MGLILAGMAGGLGAGLAGAAQEFDRRAREEELLREKLADRERDRTLREQLARDALAERAAAREDRNILLAQRGEKPGGGGGSASTAGTISDFSPGSEGEARLAMARGMTAPEMRRLLDTARTGNVDAFAKDVTRETGIDPNDPNNDGKDKVLAQSNPRVKTTTRELPKDFKPWLSEQLKEAEKSMTLLSRAGNVDQAAKAYGDLSKDTLIGRVVDAQTVDERRTAGEGVALGEGKGQFRVQGNTRINEATGEASTTAVGDSVVAKNERAPTGRGGGAASATTVQSVKEGADGEMFAVMRDGTTKPLGIKSGVFNARVASMIQKRTKEDYSFSKLPVEQQQSWAREMLANGSSGSGAASASATPPKSAPLAPAVDERKDGTWYSNSKGELMRWNAAGKGWSR